MLAKSETDPVENVEIGKEPCVLESETYLHGTEICTDITCMQCNDGKWDDKGVDASGLMQ